LKRRTFLFSALGTAAAMRLPAWAAAPTMKITKIETIYWDKPDASGFLPHWCWVRIHTDTGHVGLGETYPRGEVESAALHSAAAHTLLGKDPRDIDRIWSDLYWSFDFQVTGGAEMRALSALDLALWDLLGKSLETPVYRLIGGKSNPQIRVYNTCFGLRYDFIKEPERIMQELIDRYGVRGIKIWPFDGAGLRHKGEYITQEEIDEGLAPVRTLRDMYGDKIEIAMEFHSYWNLTSAIRIARSIEPYKPMWLEDMLMPGNFGQYAELARATSVPLIIGERMAGRYQFEALMESRAAKFIEFDVTWCGGLSEARKIQTMAEARQLPIAPHTAGGPLLFYATTHLSTAATNLWIQESVQRYYEADWPKFLDNPIVPKDGHVEAPELPGFGMQVKPEIWKHPGAVIRVST
jgi:L-alanine-DL-glutamate epimerase-like enolase superfamily enzyme